MQSIKVQDRLQRQAAACGAQASSCKPVSQTAAVSRRNGLLGLLVLAGGAAVVQPAQAAQPQPEPLTPYMQELLRRSEEKREERYKERLAAYYKKNFKEYFDVEAVDDMTARARGIKPETTAAIKRWMEENK
ncbi:hypothetical protein OEZ86_003911 [Tetradesmus obliquus]|nr:hypothetical protein OEZ86_003911 [Tetradesmus obliquus]